ncbi:MAG: DUF5110 domain-containing protein [Chloroflexi bacterium]|nr:DUF5110 domain-containing protein [Chloroflexota bacterium]
MKVQAKWINSSLIMIMMATAIFLPSPHQVKSADGGVYQTLFENDGRYLVVELLDDDLAHFELTFAPMDGSIWTTPMVAKPDYPGPSQVILPRPYVLETPDLRLKIDPITLCVTITDLTREPDLLLTTVCPASEELDGLSISQASTTDLYGLGEFFPRRADINSNLMGQRRSVSNSYGNELTSYNGGNVGNAQFPILYALGGGTDNYALFLDSIYQQSWNLKDDPFVVYTTDVAQRWYIMNGPDLQDLRRDYMELTGHPPVPPKQMFGLWVSEFGYEDWDELTGVLDSLRAAHFPQDGFVMDLQWFGGITRNNSQMGSLAWDEVNFPDPTAMIAQLRSTYGLGIMTIEEPYVSETARGYADAKSQGVLVRQCGEAACAPVSFNQWWGQGGMVDWTNPDATAWWHDNRRQHLIDEGVMGHWTDLGEPEVYDDRSWYYGFPESNLHGQADVHNIYNLMWSKSIWDGYQRNGVERRPFILSRSGASGSQRYGVAMWSGDIGANMTSLAGHLNAQMEMSLSGIDYFGSDVGGFYRDAFDPLIDEDTLYTVWLANSALLDVPLRPHTANTQNAYHTAPSLIGDVASNLANVRLRYTLSPYLYTLAQRAYRDGEPIFAPLVYYFQSDLNVRALASQKMIGPDLMMATTTNYDMDTVSVYLPAGGWFNYHTHEFILSNGEWVDTPTTIDGVFRAPLFVREGAIIPEMVVDDTTLNILGQREDGTVRNDLILNVYGAGNFTLIEDDGVTMAYQTGAVRETAITQAQCGTDWCLDIGPASGSYVDAPAQRNVEIHFITADTIHEVTLNDAPLPQLTSIEAPAMGWMMTDEGMLVVKAGVVDVTTALHFTFTTN